MNFICICLSLILIFPCDIINYYDIVARTSGISDVIREFLQSCADALEILSVRKLSHGFNLEFWTVRLFETVDCNTKLFV